MYLGACCLNRPFDDQTQDRVHLESEAVLLLVARAETGALTWVGSQTLVYEIAQTPDPTRRERVLALAGSAHESVQPGHTEAERTAELVTRGFTELDALHIACAESAAVDVFLTTDDRLLARSRRPDITLRVRVRNPLEWLQEPQPSATDKQ